MAREPTGRRTRNFFDPVSAKSFKLSRSRLDLFIDCPRCFYLDRRLGLDRPSMPGWPLNTAVDALLKNEFDQYRSRGIPHPLMVEHGIDAVPFQHDMVDTWRENFKGIQYLDPGTNLTITGAVDDIWQHSDGSLIVVDYKATSTTNELSLNGRYREGYKRQLEVYQWLFAQNGFDVNPTAYIVYANATKQRSTFDAQLTFEIHLFPHTGDYGWVGDCVQRAHACLMAAELPEQSPQCGYCLYRNAARSEEESVSATSGR